MRSRCSSTTGWMMSPFHRSIFELGERGLQQEAHPAVLGLVHADHALADRDR